MIGRNRVRSLIREVLNKSCRCPAHSSTVVDTTNLASNNEYACEVSTSTIRYGSGVTSEIGVDAKNMKGKNLLIITDRNVSKIPTFKVVLDSLSKQNIKFDIYDDIDIEPSDHGVNKAVEYSRKKSEPFDMFVAFGGGSIMDTCKIVNLLSNDREAELSDYAAKPIGKGKLVTTKLCPLIAIPTTSGTGSETTGVAVYENTEMKAKVAITSRAIKPTLGLIDPDHSAYLPLNVAIYSGFDIFCHALESYTALPYTERKPRPESPNMRPTYQGSNPFSDVWAIKALNILQKYFKRSVSDAGDREARSQMTIASCMAGMGLGNAGVHLCHGMSYPISALSPDFEPDPTSYVPVTNAHPGKKWVPHGLSVVITAPAVFRYTSALCPERHLQAASILNPDKVKGGKMEDSGKILADVILEYMDTFKIPNGLSSFGFTNDHIPQLVKGTLPQERVLKLSPKPAAEEDLLAIFKSSLTVY